MPTDPDRCAKCGKGEEHVIHRSAGGHADLLHLFVPASKLECTLHGPFDGGHCPECKAYRESLGTDKSVLASKPDETSVPHCKTCRCGQRAPVQKTRGLMNQPGTIAWWEHEKAWIGYGYPQTADRMAECGGFDYAELVEFLGHEPVTWRAGGADEARTEAVERARNAKA